MLHCQFRQEREQSYLTKPEYPGEVKLSEQETNLTISNDTVSKKQYHLNI